MADCGTLRATEQMKGRETESNNLVLFITKRKCMEYDAIMARHMTPLFSDRIIKIETTFTARKQQWPYVPFLPQFYVGDNRYAGGAHNNCGSTLTRAHQISQAERYQWRLALAPIDNCRVRRSMYAKCVFLGTDKGLFSESEPSRIAEYATRKTS